MMTAERVCKYAAATGPRILLDDNGNVVSDPTNSSIAADAGAALWREAENLAATTGRPVTVCFHELQQTDRGRELMKQYTAQANGRSIANAAIGGPPPKQEDPADRTDRKIDKMAKEHMTKTGEKNYSLAVGAVLQADPNLNREYKKFRSYGV